MNNNELNEAIALKLHKGYKLVSIPLNDISSQTMTILNNSCRAILDYSTKGIYLFTEL